MKSQIYRAMNSYMTRALEPYNLSLPEWTLIGLLFEGGPEQPTEIAKTLDVKPPVVTSSLRRLEEKKFVKTRKQTKDGRLSKVELTKKAENTIKKAEEKIQNDFKVFTRGIKKSEINHYLDGLEEISRRLQERRRSL